jgi:predicted NAD-dependent protein-ADP-ribosyltransferase YbiA (DUF1768 family)
MIRHMSLFHPPEGFPPHLVVFWPLVWFQLRLLGAVVRAAYGKDATYRWSITPNGRVFLTCIHFRMEDKAARVADAARAFQRPPCRRLRWPGLCARLCGTVCRAR